MSMTQRKLFGILAVLALAASPVLGAPITAIDLFSTGVAPAVPGGNDLHYVFNTDGAPVTPVAASVVPNAGIPATPPYVWNVSALAGGTSAWIAPLANVADLSTPTAAVTYEYWTTFDLTDYNSNSVIITGNWMADNYGQIKLNSANLPGAGATIADGLGAYTTWHPFEIKKATSPGLLAGENTLKFSVTNAFVSGVNPSGLRVQFDSTFDEGVGVPEPGTLALLGGGLLALGFFRRRR